MPAMIAGRQEKAIPIPLSGAQKAVDDAGVAKGCALEQDQVTRAQRLPLHLLHHYLVPRPQRRQHALAPHPKAKMGRNPVLNNLIDCLGPALIHRMPPTSLSG
jgi:hypothetical protein